MPKACLQDRSAGSLGPEPTLSPLCSDTLKRRTNLIDHFVTFFFSFHDMSWVFFHFLT